MMLKITEEMRAAAGKLLRDPALKFDRPDRELLTAIADGKRKLIRGDWWVNHFKVVDRTKLDKLQRMADPARNPMEHERETAARMLGEFKGRRAPGLGPEPPPLPLPSPISRQPFNLAASISRNAVRCCGCSGRASRMIWSSWSSLSASGGDMVRPRARVRRARLP
jgi:hypothetical protein